MTDLTAELVEAVKRQWTPDETRFWRGVADEADREGLKHGVRVPTKRLRAALDHIDAQAAEDVPRRLRRL